MWVVWCHCFQPLCFTDRERFVSGQMRQLAGVLNEGDCILSNHPSAGGSHLPDLTVITPVGAHRCENQSLGIYFFDVALFRRCSHRAMPGPYSFWPTGATTPILVAPLQVQCPPTLHLSSRKELCSNRLNWSKVESFKKKVVLHLSF